MGSLLTSLVSIELADGKFFFLFWWQLWRTLKIKLTYFQAMMSGWRTFTYVSTLVQFSFLSFGVLPPGPRADGRKKGALMLDAQADYNQT